MQLYLISILAALNLIGFIVVGIDKRKAIKRKWRVQEKTFFILSLLGGSIGVYIGLLAFRHKTRHWYFMLGIPAIIIAQVVGVYFLSMNVDWI